MAIATIPGFPRIGRNRELKWALESYWQGKSAEPALLDVAATVKQSNWQSQRAAGLDLIPVNDFSLYDHVLDTAVTVGAVPDRYGAASGTVGLDTYFEMARGRSGASEIRAMEMTKWFDTNYHYIVPEFTANQTFQSEPSKPRA